MKRIPAEESFSRLPAPRDYYSGMGCPPFPVPENIILFYRGGVFDPFFLNESYSWSHHRYVAVFNFAEPLQVLLEEDIIRIGEHECLLILPHQYHRFINDHQRHLSLAFVTFTLGETVYFENMHDTVFRFGEDVEETLETVVHDYRGGEARILPYRAALLLIQAFGNGEDHPGLLNPMDNRSGSHETSSHEMIIRIIRAVRGDRSAAIGDISRALGYSESYMRSRFKRKMGVPLGRFILEMRLARAKQALLETDDSISRIADSCGWGSLYAFSRSFRNHCNMSPSEYRRAVRLNPRAGESKRFVQAAPK